jgi:hypothetical protein
VVVVETNLYTLGLDLVGEWCALCGEGTPGSTACLYLASGLEVWLCAEHRSDAFLRRDGGRAFTHALAQRFLAYDELGAQLVAALEAHEARVQACPSRPRPGSYTWPDVRAELEQRRAAGEPLPSIEADLRERYAGGLANLPSRRTFARWSAEARWRYGSPLRLVPPPRSPSTLEPPEADPAPRARRRGHRRRSSTRS